MFSTAANRWSFDAAEFCSFRTLDVCFCGFTAVISRMLVWLMSIA